jgi:uncharacterized protein YceK
VVSLALSGCGTLFDTLGEESRGTDRRDGLSLSGGKCRIYGGVRWDAETLAEARAGWLLAVFAVDLPLSAVVDTLLLPVTVPYNLSR